MYYKMSVCNKVKITMADIIYKNMESKTCGKMAMNKLQRYNIKQINSLPLRSYPFTNLTHLENQLKVSVWYNFSG